jgi:hypothetical protein
MTVYGFHASHEQVPPADLLAAVVRAEQTGFTAAMWRDDPPADAAEGVVFPDQEDSLWQ